MDCCLNQTGKLTGIFWHFIDQMISWGNNLQFIKNIISCHHEVLKGKLSESVRHYLDCPSLWWWGFSPHLPVKGLQYKHFWSDVVGQRGRALRGRQTKKYQMGYYFGVLFSSQVLTWTSSPHSPPQCVFWLAALHESCPGHRLASFYGICQLLSNQVFSLRQMLAIHQPRCLWRNSIISLKLNSATHVLQSFLLHSLCPINTQLAIWSTLSWANTELLGWGVYNMMHVTALWTYVALL